MCDKSPSGGIRGAQSFVTARMMRSVRPAHLAFLIAAVVVVLAAISGLTILSTGGDEAKAGNGTTHTVFVNNSKFCGSAGIQCTQPYSIQIDAGDSVVWPAGQDLVPHSVRQCSGDGTGCPGGSPGFDSGISTPDFDVNPSFEYLTQSFPDVGTFFYRCQVHGNSMRGIITVGSPTTPTASPPPSPTATATAPPTETATPTPSPATATPAPTLSGRSDVNCDGETNGDDVLALLLHSADATPAAAPLGNGCAPIGSANGDGLKGDLNCDGLVDARDALVALYGWAGLTVPGLPDGCLGP